MNSKVVFFGTGVYVLPILEILKTDFKLSLVLTTEKDNNEPVSKFCRENKISHISIQKFSNETILAIKKSDAEIGILANFGLILPQALLDIFPKGIINVHPSLLPKYRGPTPGQTAILNGDIKTGVSIIKLDEEIDHGPILTQQEEPILTDDTADTLYVRLFKIGSTLLSKCIPIYLSGELNPTEQNHEQATFTKTLTRDSGFIDLSSLEIGNLKLEIDRMVKAYFPWPGVWTKTKLGNTEKIIKLLPNEKIQVEGKKEMSHKDFINGYPEGKEILQKLALF